MESTDKGSGDDSFLDMLPELLDPINDGEADTNGQGIGCPVRQVNGQKLCGPPNDWIDPPPPKGSEVYLRRIPRSWDENVLWPYLNRYGKVYMLRLMMDFSGSNRGFGFVRYATRAEAQDAIKLLNEKNELIAKESLDNCRLYIGNLPPNVTQTEIFNVFSRFVDGIQRVILLSPKANRSKQFCFVDFEDHRSAAMGRRALISPNFGGWQGLRVDWSTSPSSKGFDKTRTLCLGPLVDTYSQYQVKNLLRLQCVDARSITKIAQKGDIFQLEFIDKNAALLAFKILQQGSLQGLVNWAHTTFNVSCPQNGPDCRRSFSPSSYSGSRSSHGLPKIGSSSSNMILDDSHKSDLSGEFSQDQENRAFDCSNINELDFHFLSGSQSINGRANQLLPMTVQPNYGGYSNFDLFLLETEYSWMERRLAALLQRFPTNRFRVLETLLGELGWGTLLAFRSLPTPVCAKVELKLLRGIEMVDLFECWVPHDAPNALQVAVNRFISMNLNNLVAYLTAKTAYGPGASSKF